MKVYLVQHGACLEKTVNPEQPLSEKGRKDIGSLCQFLSLLSIESHCLWHSGKLRAQQTAEILVSSLASSVTIESREGLAPMDEIGVIEKTIYQLNQNVLLVGHMPFLGKLAAKFLVANETQNLIAFEPGTMVCLAQNEKQAWQMQWMIRPDIVSQVIHHENKYKL